MEGGQGERWKETGREREAGRGAVRKKERGTHVEPERGGERQ